MEPNEISKLIFNKSNPCTDETDLGLWAVEKLVKQLTVEDHNQRFLHPTREHI